MTDTSTHGRALAIITGAAFLAGGLTILLGPVLLTPALWGQYHVLTILMIGGTIAAGHLTKTAWKARMILSCFGFLLLFLSGTALVVYNSVGRQAEAHDTITLEAQARNGLIKDKHRDIESARQRLRVAEQNADRERGSKCKTRCKDWEAAAVDARKVISVLESEVKALGAPKPVDAKAAKAGDLAALFGFDKTKAEAIASLIEPFLWTIFFEIGSIVSLGFAFRPMSRPRSIAKVSTFAKVSAQPTPETVNINKAEEDYEITAIKDALKNCKAPMTKDALAEKLKCSKSEASKRVSRAVNLGIVTRRRIGKEVAIAYIN